MKKRIFALILAVLMMLFFAACFSDVTRYTGSHPELYVVATHSLLGVPGGMGADVLILDEDDYGRILFAYIDATSTTTSTASFSFSIVAVLVAQRTTETHSYFYDGINFILYEYIIRGAPRVSDFFDETFVMQRFTEEQLEELRAENSWNQELDEGRFFRVPVSRRSKERYMTAVSVRARQEAYLAVVGETGENFRPGHGTPLSMDKNGNVIFFMRGSVRDSETNTMTRYPAFLFMFDNDGNLIEETGVMALPDENLWDYRELLIEFKAANGWSFSYR